MPDESVTTGAQEGDEKLGAFTKVTTLHDLDKYMKDWNFERGKMSHDNLRQMPVQFIDSGTMEGLGIEVGVTVWNGELVVSLAREGTFS
jgi:hypothetical protein